jgi:hypothetical protein
LSCMAGVFLQLLFLGVLQQASFEASERNPLTKIEIAFAFSEHFAFLSFPTCLGK